MMKLLNKKTIALLVIAVLAVGFAWIAHVEKQDRNYAESVIEVEKEFQQFVESTDKIISGGKVSFDDFTEQYMQMRIYLSNWNHLYFDLQMWDQLVNCDMNTAGEFYEAVETLYFDIVHMYYIKDVPVNGAAIVNECKVLKERLTWFQI